MKKLNLTDYEVLEIILKDENATRIDIANSLDLSPAAISKIIKKLSGMNLIHESESEIKSSHLGRPGKILKINYELKKIMGINFGPGFIVLSISCMDGIIIENITKKFRLKSPEKLQALLTELINEFLEKYGKENFIGIGISMNGTVDTKNGISIFSPHLKWKNWKLKDYVEETFNIPVVVDNDVTCMLRAEMYKYNIMNLKNVVLIYFSEGIGSSIMINGEIFEGDNFAAGEIGHFIIDANSNAKCKCGKYGCLEAEYSASAVLEKVAWELENKGIDFNPNNITAKDVFIKASEGENPYCNIIKSASYDLGKVVGNVLNVLNIENIIVAGDILYAKHLFFDNFKEGMNKVLSLNFGINVNVFPSKFSHDIEKYSALYLVIMNIFSGKRLMK